MRTGRQYKYVIILDDLPSFADERAAAGVGHHEHHGSLSVNHLVTLQSGAEQRNNPSMKSTGEDETALNQRTTDELMSS